MLTYDNVVEQHNDRLRCSGGAHPPTVNGQPVGATPGISQDNPQTAGAGGGASPPAASHPHPPPPQLVYAWLPYPYPYPHSTEQPPGAKPPPRDFGGSQNDADEKSEKPKGERCANCGEKGCVATSCGNDPIRPSDKRRFLYCFDFQKPPIGNNSGPEGKQHCGNPNCPYLHELPTDEDGETKLKERHAKQQEKKKEKETKGADGKDGDKERGKGGYDPWARFKGDGGGKGKGKWTRRY